MKVGRGEYRHHKLSADQNAVIDRFQKALPKSPVNILALAQEFGCEVTKMPMAWDVSGAIHRQSTGQYRIYVNERDSRERQRFTCAHELAHFLLHRDVLEDKHEENVMYRSNLSNDKEISANKLAAEILMPYETLNRVAETRRYGIRELAEVFGVSRQALLVRLGIPDYPRAGR